MPTSLLLVFIGLATASLESRPFDDPPTDRPVVKNLTPNAAARSHLPNLVAGDDGQLYLSWVEPGENGRVRLRFSRLEDARWSKPRTIASGSDWFVNWADFPSLAVSADGTMAAHWLGRLGVGTYAYGVQLALSTDRGRTWSSPITPHSDRSPTEHGFVSMVPSKKDGFSIVWLDGRAMAGGHGDDHELGHGRGDMSLRIAEVDRKGQVTGERVLDDRTCECCQTAAVRLGDEVIVAWRDRSETEVRDISWTRVSGSKHTPPRPLRNDNWNQEGCPVNGPALAAHGSELAAVWYTEGDGRPRIWGRASTDGGETFTDAIPLDDGNPVGRVDVTRHPDGGWLACWLERGDRGGEIRVRRFGAKGAPGASLLIARTSTARASGYPRIETLGRRVIVAWTETTRGETAVSPTALRTAELVYPATKGPQRPASGPKKEKGTPSRDGGGP